MKIESVKNKNQIKRFLTLPIGLNKNFLQWIRPLDKDIESVFDPEKNKYFRHGEINRWILQTDQGETIGRVAAFINQKTADTFDQPTGGMGFFECINDQAAADLLFDTCKKWLQERNMEAMDGPINFGDRDRWWGLLVDGFDLEPNYCSPYNPPYYQLLFENYGFQVYFKQFTYARNMHEAAIDKDLATRIKLKAKPIRENPEFKFEHINKKFLAKYAEDFRFVYNKAWVKHLGVKEMNKEQAVSIMNKLKPIIDERLIWFGYYRDEPVAFYIGLPELNQIFKYVNGTLNLWGKLQFIYHKKMKTVKKMFGVSFGVVPEWQGKEVETALIDAFSEIAWHKSLEYNYVEMNWIGDFNPKMMHIVKNLGTNIVKTHVTYRKLFDEAKPFERSPIIK
jgi:hypothetical protein